MQHPDTTTLDASALIMPLVKFVGPSDPRFLSTLNRIGAELVTDSLVRRYQTDGSDGLTGGEGTFSLCSFWYVEALTRAGRLSQARHMFEQMLTYANHLGLYAEEVGPAGEALGNFPKLSPPGSRQRRCEPRPSSEPLQDSVAAAGAVGDPSWSWGLAHQPGPIRAKMMSVGPTVAAAQPA